MAPHRAGRTPALLATALFVAGYPLAIAVIVRWVPVVREQRVRWLAAHHAGVVAIVAGWAIEGRWPSVAVNAAWLAISTAWYVVAGRGTMEA